MDRDTIKDALYGSIVGLMDNSSNFYKSSVLSYSHFTDEGRVALADMVSLFVEEILKEEQRQLDSRAKEMVINGLKGENN